jgi:hypothetical protein
MMKVLPTEDKNGFKYFNPYPLVNFGDDKNACTVVSLANCLGIEYNTAKLFMQSRADRKKGKGVKSNDIESALLSLKSYEVEEVDVSDIKYLKEFKELHPEGIYYILVTGHALSLIHGEIYDHSWKPRRRLKRVWRIEKK